MNNDLISREALKKALHSFFDGKVIDEPTYILRDVLCHIDSAPVVDQRIEYGTDGQPYRLFMSGGQVVPDMLQGWRYEERPQGDIFPMEIVAGTCPIEAGGNCPLKPQGEWISVSERLPEKEGFYLVFLENEQMVVAHSSGIIANHDFEPKMLAWQPLPEPYKKGGAE